MITKFGKKDFEKPKEVDKKTSFLVADHTAKKVRENLKRSELKY